MPTAPAGRHAPRTPTLPLALAAGGLLLLGALVLLADDAQASHTRGGSTSWEVENRTPAGGGVEIRILATSYWRMSYYSWTGWGCAAATCGVGDVLRNGGIESESDLTDGQGNNLAFDARVIAVDAANDWFGVELIQDGAPATTRAGVVVNYPTPLNGGNPWTARQVMVCCRTANPSTSGGAWWYHINNPGGTQQIWTDIVADGMNRAPVLALPPIVNCDRPAVCTFPVPAIDPDGDPLAFRLATSTEVGGSFDQPRAPLSQNLTIDPATGLVTWNTTGASICCSAPWPPSATRHVVYSAHVVVEDGQGGTQSAVDWFIRLMPPSPNPPYWVTPPTPCGQTLLVLEGNTLTFTVRARSNGTGRTITLGSSAMPSPLAAIAWSAWGNPSQGVFTWGTTPADRGNYIMVFWAVDDLGASAPICPVTIRVVGSMPDFTCTPVGALRVMVSPQLFDPHGLVVDEWWNVDGGPDQPSAPGTIVRPAPGPFTVAYTVRDTFGNVIPVTRTCVAPPNSPPVMDPVPDQTVLSSRMLVFDTQGSDPDGDPLEYRATGLPPGAVLGATTGGVTWRAPVVSAPVTYTVTAWVREAATAPPRPAGLGPLLDSNQVTYRITVIPLPPPGPDEPDVDRDGVVDRLDNCVHAFNDEQGDADDDGTGDVCEARGTGGGEQAGAVDAGAPDRPAAPRDDAPAGSAPGAGVGAPDADRDGVPDATDWCPALSEPLQRDLDRDGLGDACDPDIDGDGVPQLDGLGRLLDRCPRDDADGCADALDDGAGGGGSGGDADDADAGGTPGPAGTDGRAADQEAFLARVPALGWALGGLALLVLVAVVAALVLRRRPDAPA